MPPRSQSSASSGGKDLDNPENAETLEWCGEYDPEAFNVESVNKCLPRWPREMGELSSNMIRQLLRRHVAFENILPLAVQELVATLYPI